MIDYSAEKNIHSSVNTGMVSINLVEALVPRMVCDDGLRIVNIS